MVPEQINQYTKLNSFSLNDVLLYVKQNSKQLKKMKRKKLKKQS